jgi:hypothetical protein
MTLFYGQPHGALNADLIRMDKARAEIEAAIGAITALKGSSILNDTQDAMQTLIDGLIDVKSDLSHAIACAEDAATLKAAE